MKLAIVGQQDFGKAVLEAFLARGDQVAGVFCAPEKPGARPDALKVAASEKAILEAADLVVAGKHSEAVQDESQASYEGWCRKAEARLNWANPVEFIYNTIRGCNPAPGAWTTLAGQELQIFDARKHVVRTFS